MENLFWRPWARVVAYLDLVLWIVMLMVDITLFYLVTTEAMIAATKDEKVILVDDASDPIKHVDYWMTWVGVALFALLTGLHLWASLTLLSGTEFGRSVKEALEKARFWRNVTFVLLVIDVVYVAIDIFLNGIVGWYASGIVWMVLEICLIICRVNFMFVVYKYLEEMETTLVSGRVGGAAAAGYINPA